MKLNNVVVESYNSISINGILYSMNNDEKSLYDKIKKEKKVLKRDLDEFMQRIATEMVSKGILHRKKNKQGDIYFTSKGRRKNMSQHPLDEVAPPDKDIEKWIGDNKERFKEKYGKKYGKYLYGKAWNKFNGKALNEHLLQQILNKYTLTEAITGYHGSPYDFDKFDVKFIGSGQGAIAHGWGLYFAIEDPRTAKGYKDNYTKRPGSYVSYSFEKKSYPKGSVMFRVLKLIKNNGKEIAIDSLNDLLKQKEWIESNPNNEEYVKQLIEKIDKIDEDKIKEKIHVNKGQRFTVKLPNLTNFLDEQKNMSEQSKKVQSVMKKIAKDKKIDMYDSINGRDFYYKLGNLIQSSNDWNKAKYASQLLYQYGVVGIKYNGYSDGDCVVMFNGDDVKIIKKEVNVEKDTVQLPMLHKIMEDPHLLKTIENPSDEIILAALKEDLTTIQYVENPSDEVKDFVIEQNWVTAIEYIKEFNEKQVDKLLEISHDDSRVITKFWYMIDDKKLDELLKDMPNTVILIFNNSFDLSEELQAKAYDLLYYILLRNDIHYIDNIINSSDYDRELLTTYLNEKGETYVKNNCSSVYHVFQNILSALAPSINDFDQLSRNMILYGTHAYDYLDELKVEDIDCINDWNARVDTLMVKDTCIIKEDALVEFIGLVMNSRSSIQSNIYDRLSVDKKIDICLKKKNYISYFIQYTNVKELNEYLNNDEIRSHIFKEEYHISNYIVEEYFLQLDKDIQYKVLQSFYWDRDFERIQIFKKLFQDNKDVNIQKIIFRTNLPLMKYINNIDEKVQMKMIEKNPFNIKYINNASPKVIEKATSMNPQVKDYIR